MSRAAAFREFFPVTGFGRSPAYGSWRAPAHFSRSAFLEPSKPMRDSASRCVEAIHCTRPVRKGVELLDRPGSAISARFIPLRVSRRQARLGFVSGAREEGWLVQIRDAYAVSPKRNGAMTPASLMRARVFRTHAPARRSAARATGQPAERPSDTLRWSGVHFRIVD